MFKKKVLKATLIICVGILVGCGNSGNSDNSVSVKDNPETGFYTLTEAYENGWITKGNLQSIAYYHNENILCSEILDDSIANAIKETAAKEMRKLESDAKAEDFRIEKYYGVYNESYAVIIDNPYAEAPAVDVDVWEEVYGVKFHYTNIYKIKIWKEKT